MCADVVVLMCRVMAVVDYLSVVLRERVGRTSAVYVSEALHRPPRSMRDSTMDNTLFCLQVLPPAPAPVLTAPRDSQPSAHVKSCDIDPYISQTIDLKQRANQQQ